jgi:hypothetical protein
MIDRHRANQNILSDEEIAAMGANAANEGLLA